jgi:signal transduction histidine kinase/DNA-binding response OmpR family regulator
MRKTKHSLLVFILGIFPILLFGQLGKTDSLKALLPLAKDTQQLFILHQIFLEYARFTPTPNPDSAIYYGEQGLVLCEKYPDLKKNLSFKYRLAENYLKNDQQQKALQYFKEALPLSLDLERHQNAFYIYSRINYIYGKQAISAEVIKNFETQLALADSLQLPKQKAWVYSGQGNYYRSQKQLQKALIALKKAEKIFQEEQDLKGLLYNHLRTGLVYGDLGAHEQYVGFLNKAVSTNYQLNTFDSILINDNYGRAYRFLKDFDNSKKYLDIAIEQSKRSKNNRFLNHASNELMDLYYEHGLYDKALEIGKKLALRAKNGDNLKNKIDIKRNLSEIYAAKKNFPIAYQLLLESKTLSDSIFDVEKIQEQAEVENRIAIAEKDKKLLIQEKELAQKNNQQNQLIAILLGLFFASSAIFLWYRYRLKKKELEKTQLAAINKMKSQFFTNISHELRTPLTLITGPINQVLEETENKNHHQLLSLVQRNSQKLKQLINQLLDFSKIEANKLKLQAIQQDILPLAKGIFESFQSLAEQKNIQLNFKSSHSTIPLYFDADKMETILTNILSNALKFTATDGSIYFAIHQKENIVEMSIQDTGIGIPAAQLPFIFDRFYQTDQSASREYEGTGIGLALTKELIQLHDAQIQVSSQIGKGTTFLLQFPIIKTRAIVHQLTDRQSLKSIKPQQVKIKKKQVARTSNRKKNPTKSKKKPLVLIIEDNEDVRFFIRQGLEQDYRIAEAINGVDGFQLASELLPDLVLSDIMMPKMNGYDLTTQLKKQVITSHIPIILLTAKTTRSEKLTGLSTGANDYLIKPFDRKELKFKIQNLIAIQRQKQSYLKAHLVSETTAIVENSMDKQFLEKAYAILKQNLDNELFGVEDFAKAINMSTTHLNRKLRALCDKSSRQFILAYRMEKAAAALKNKTGTIAEISAQVGFSSPTYFSKVFKNYFGVTPKKYVIN